MWKKKVSCLILVLMLSGLIGCGGKDGPAEVPKNPAPIPPNGPTVRGDTNTKAKSFNISTKLKP